MAPVATTPEPIRVFLVDREARFRDDLRAALEHDGLEVAGDAGDAGDAALRLGAEPVDVVAVDAAGAGESLAALMRAAAGSAVVALSASHEPDAVVRALAAGADAYLLKDDAVEDVAGPVLRAAAFGESLVSPRIARHVIARLHELAPHTEPPAPLTERELQVLRLMADGLGSGEIGDLLDLSIRAVEHHVASIHVKLGVANRPQAAAADHTAQRCFA